MVSHSPERGQGRSRRHSSRTRSYADDRDGYYSERGQERSRRHSSRTRSYADDRDSYSSGRGRERSGRHSSKTRSYADDYNGYSSGRGRERTREDAYEPRSYADDYYGYEYYDVRSPERGSQRTHGYHKTQSWTNGTYDYEEDEPYYDYEEYEPYYDYDEGVPHGGRERMHSHSYKSYSYAEDPSSERERERSNRHSYKSYSYAKDPSPERGQERSHRHSYKSYSYAKDPFPEGERKRSHRHSPREQSYSNDYNDWRQTREENNSRRHEKKAREPFPEYNYGTGSSSRQRGNTSPNYGPNSTYATKPDHYATLGVSHNASQEEIRKVSKKRRIDVHPDTLRRKATQQGKRLTRADEEKIERVAKEVGEAADVLGDRGSRLQYDKEMRRSGDYR